MLQVVITLLIALALVVPTGRYLYKVFAGGPAPFDRVFLPLERLIYKLVGVKDPDESMNWKTYGLALLVSNGAVMLLAYVLLRFQHILPWNPQGIGAMEPRLAFHTVSAFITGTDQQHYSGETGLSYLSQMVLTCLMFIAPASSLVAAIAFSRALAGKPVGNFWTDMTRSVVRVLLPVSLVLAVFFVWQGTPQTFSPSIQATTVEGAVQTIAVGPAASFVSIKQLGNNGGGFWGPNSAHPFESPTPLTNLLHILAMLWMTTSLIYTFGLFIKNKKQGWVLFTAVSVLFVLLLGTSIYFERLGNPALHQMGLTGPSMEGKEVRFGVDQSALYATVTTATETGAVNNMHDSMAPMSGFVELVNMMLNTVLGGVGAGFLNIVAAAMVGVFLVGLMVGRTPEFLGKKLETKEIVLLAIVILMHPLFILAPTALSLAVEAGRSAISHSDLFHGFSQVLYEYTSAAANNGSGFEGLGDNTPFWNISAGLVMLLGRYPSILALLGVAGFLAAKKPVPEGPGTLRTDTVLFGAVLTGVILIVGALTFFPALALGPIAEHLTLFSGR